MATVAPTTTLPAAPLAPPPLYRFTTDEYERMILDDPRVELIDGYVVKKMPKSAEHCYTTKEVVKALDRRIRPGWTSRQEQPVRIPDYDEPEPDVAIVRGVDADYRHRIPEPADVALLVEVSGPTLSTDRGKQLLAYARAGIPWYWIINIDQGHVEVYSGPGPAGYQSRVDFMPGQQVPVVIDGQQLGAIAVDDILP